MLLPWIPRKKLYSTCDFVSLHIPGTKETVNSINYELLSNMKEGAALINTSPKRGHRRGRSEEDALPKDRISATDRT